MIRDSFRFAAVTWEYFLWHKYNNFFFFYFPSSFSLFINDEYTKNAESTSTKNFIFFSFLLISFNSWAHFLWIILWTDLWIIQFFELNVQWIFKITDFLNLKYCCWICTVLRIFERNLYGFKWCKNNLYGL